MEPTKICKTCNKELPESAFRLSRWGKCEASCRECQVAKIKASRLKNGGGKSTKRNIDFSEFNGKTPREIIDMMTMGKLWLEQQGYDISLSGVHRKVIESKVKFEL